MFFLVSAEKDIERWKRVKEERFGRVEAVLARNGFARKSTRGSHFVFRNRTIEKYCKVLPEYFLRDVCPDGSLVIVQHGNSVKRCYLLRAAGILEKLSEIMELEEKILSGQAA